MPPPRDRIGARAAVALLLGAAVWAAAVIVAPALANTATASPALIASVTIYGVGGLVCHQRADRSFHSANARWPVCARCTGLYVSAGVGSLLILASRPWWRHLVAGSGARGALLLLLLAAAAPTLASWSLERLGLITTGNVLRAVLAVPLGLAVAALLAYVWQAAGAVWQVR